jgi:protein-tyrosine phosphatase
VDGPTTTARDADPRELVWDGCVNVRDLGGLPTEDGGTTRFGAVVRSDNSRRLTDAGWKAAVAHGIRTVVDVRLTEELARDATRALPVELVNVSLLSELHAEHAADRDARLVSVSDPVARIRESYLDFAELYRPNVARIVGAVADAPDGGVLVHCQAGKDRTGLVVALLLRIAGVAPDDVADDYAASERNLAAIHALWVAEAPDERGATRPEDVGTTPRAAMSGVLERLERDYGGVREYLLAGGATPAQLDRARARLTGR